MLTPRRSRAGGRVALVLRRRRHDAAHRAAVRHRPDRARTRSASASRSACFTRGPGRPPAGRVGGRPVRAAPAADRGALRHRAGDGPSPRRHESRALRRRPGAAGRRRGRIPGGDARRFADLAPPRRVGEGAQPRAVALWTGVAIGPMVGVAAGGRLVSRRSGSARRASRSAAPRLARLVPETRPVAIPGSPRGRLFHPAGGAARPARAVRDVGMAAFLAFLPPTRRCSARPAARPLTVYGVIILAIRLGGARLPDRVGPVRLSGIALAVIASWPVAARGAARLRGPAVGNRGVRGRVGLAVPRSWRSRSTAHRPRSGAPSWDRERVPGPLVRHRARRPCPGGASLGYPATFIVSAPWPPGVALPWPGAPGSRRPRRPPGRLVARTRAAMTVERVFVAGAGLMGHASPSPRRHRQANHRV